MNPDRKDKVRTCLWFEKDGEEAARYYCSLIAGSGVDFIFRQDPSGPPVVIEFHLGDTPYQILNGGPHHSPTPAASISVLTEDQAETDRLWDALVRDGGSEGWCSWLTDRWGVSWQIVPRRLMELLLDTDPEVVKRAFEAMHKMRKIDVAALDAACGETAE